MELHNQATALSEFVAVIVWSVLSRAMALTLTHLLISARCWFMASILTTGMTRAAPVPRAGQMAPNTGRPR